MSTEKDANFVSMVNSIKEDVTSLVNSHIELAQAEAKEALGHVSKYSALFITSIAMANLAIAFVFLAFAFYLNAIGYKMWVSALFVVGGLSIGSVLFAVLAKRQISKITIGSKTVKSVSNTVQTISSIRPGSK
jgi:Flp pilus assembly protein TadB